MNFWNEHLILVLISLVNNSLLVILPLLSSSCVFEPFMSIFWVVTDLLLSAMPDFLNESRVSLPDPLFKKRTLMTKSSLHSLKRERA